MRASTSTPSINIDEVIRNMKENIENAQVMIDGCKEIEKQAGGMGGFGDKEQKRRKMIMDKGAGEVIISGMVKHKNNADVQSCGCEALMSLSLNDENKISLMKFGAGEVIMNAMNNHKMDADVQENGCGALKKFSI